MTAPPLSALPVQLTSFVGRGAETEALARLLEGTRLLTLTGAGGSGKTRLALEVAARFAREGGPPVAWVELAPVRGDEGVAPQVAAALGVQEVGARSTLEGIVQVVGDRPFLLALDNCEHVVDACARLADALLRACPSLRILATSREALGVGGERAWLVPALSLPPERAATAAELGASEAVRLFVERARGVDPGFALTDAGAAAVAQLCRRLDGLPLAIELAAARVRVLSPAQLAARLDDRFRLLGTGGRTAVPRHRTLRAVIDWSHDLLAERERVLFRRLSTFAGDFALEDAEGVCAGAPLEGGEVLDALSALVDRSLLAVRPGEGEARYAFLESVREYGRERLRESGEAGEVERRHTAYFLALAEECEPIVGAVPATGWLERLEHAHDDLRAALRRAVDGGDAEIAARLAAGLSLFWRLRGHMAEGRRWIREALAVPGEAPPRARAVALFGAGNMAAVQGDWAVAKGLFEECLALCRTLPHPEWTARTLGRLGSVAFEQGDLEGSERFYDESWALARDTGDRAWMGVILNNRGAVAELRGDDARAAALYEEGLALAREAGYAGGAIVFLGNLGRIAHRGGDWRRASARFRESLETAWALGDRYGVASELSDLAGVAAVAGDLERAARLFGAAEALFTALGAHHAPMDRPQHDRNLAHARSRLSADAWERAWAEGEAMPLEEAVAYAISADPVEGAPSAGASSTDSAGSPDAKRAPALRVRALGPLEIELEGRPMDPAAWRHARPRELLLYLVAHPEGRTREQIGLVFWPDATAAQVKNNFHVTLHHLRKALGAPGWIGVEGERYRVSPERGVELDAALFEGELRAALRDTGDPAARIARLEAALGLWRGEFLEDAAAGDWHLEIRDRLRLRYVEGMAALGTLLLESGALDRAVEAFERVLAVDDLEEGAHRALMLALARRGDRARALRQYERLLALLDDELGADPDAETVELAARIQRAEPV
ncbi:MAG TPA: BTAD domain-containing putative transcriptional regulator [Longimicrobium sp.]|nr:BTAD domain-containing putative transcriptional regulator [Longimicrobium sp.]